MTIGRMAGTLSALGWSIAWACGGLKVDDEAVDGGRRTSVDGGGPTVYEPPAPDHECPRTCSPDLHDVLDCEGRIVRRCEDALGCANGQCEDACDAASALRSPAGCRYYAPLPPQSSPGAGSCFVVALTNTWGADVHVDISFKGIERDIGASIRIASDSNPMTYLPLSNGALPPNKTALVFLAHDAGAQDATLCPPGITPVLTGESTFSASPAGTGRGDAFAVRTDRPVVAHLFDAYGAGNGRFASAARLSPIGAATPATSDMAQTAWGPNPVGGEPFLQLVALEDGTAVQIAPTADIVGNDHVAPVSKGSVGAYRLDRGELIQFLQADDLNGSFVSTTKPVAIWGGSTGLCLETTGPQCNRSRAPVPTRRASGSTYVAVRHAPRSGVREEPPIWRVSGIVDGTTLTYSPSKPNGAPSAVQRSESLTFRTSAPFVVRSQDDSHPFALSEYMTDADDEQGTATWLPLANAEEGESNYAFFTDPSYPETRLVVIRKKTDGELHDVILDCAGRLGGWQPVDAADDYELARFSLVEGSEPRGHCVQGTHFMQSDVPFNVAVWAWGKHVSYAYTIATGGGG